MAAGTWSAAAVALNPAQPVAVVWSAGNHGEPIPARLQQLGFAAPPHEPLAWGEWDAALSGVRARAFDLPAGPKRLRLALQAAHGARAVRGERITSVHWRGDEPFEETLEGTANRMTILHTRSAEDHVHVDLLPVNAADIAPALALGTPYERTELNAGVCASRSLRRRRSESPADAPCAHGRPHEAAPPS